MSQIDKIKKQSSSSFSKLGDALKPENQNFFPFALHEIFHSIDDKLICDYCGGSDFSGNSAGYYSACIVFQGKGKEPNVCCCLKTCTNSPGKMWRYEDQVYGQSKPLSIPNGATLAWQMVFDRWFCGTSNRFKIMQYTQINFDIFKKICQPSSFEGGSFKKAYLYYNGQKLIYSSEIRKDEKAIIKALSNSEIVDIINEMLSAMRFVQLKLF